MVQATVEIGNQAACLRCGAGIEKGDLCESCDHEITALYCEQHQLPIGPSGLCAECAYEAQAEWCGEHGVIVNADGSCRECDEILARGPVDALDGPPVVLEPPADMDFVRLYANYADVLEVPKMMHEAVGIQLVASLLNRNGVVIPLGGGVTYTLDV